MPGAEYPLLRPVQAGMIRYADLLGTELDLADIALMNDFLEVEAENQRRLADAFERARREEERR